VTDLCLQFYQLPCTKQFGATPPSALHPLVLELTTVTKLINHKISPWPSMVQQVSLNSFNAMEFLGLMPPASLTKSYTKGYVDFGR